MPMNEGKPQNQSLAISYAMKRKAKKMKDGGAIKASLEDEFGSSQPEKKDYGPSYMNEAAHKMKPYEPSLEDGHPLPSVENIKAGEDDFAEGGEVHEDDMIDKIMKKRMSEGGMVANEDHGHNDSELAGFSPNEFDDLALRDELEEHYTGANSGDEIGDAQEEHDREDIISRIMKSRAKKDRLPNQR